MKIKPEHVKLIHNAMRETILKAGFKTIGDVVKDYQEKRVEANDIRRRVVWDVLKASTIENMPAISWICQNIYPYANDNHIDTVLRQFK